MSFEEFKKQLDEDLRTAGSALQENGYDLVEGKEYSTFYIDTKVGMDHYNSDSDPLEALDQTLDEMTEEDRIEIIFDGEDLVNGIRGDIDPVHLFIEKIRGSVEVVDPLADVEWADDVLAFGTYVNYKPDLRGEYFEIGTALTQPPYTQEDARERAEDIQRILKDHDLDAEIKYID